MLILHFRMKELVTIQYGSFTILGKRVKEFAQRTSCSKWVADQTLQGQLNLSKLRREHPGWNTTQCQEWGLFLLDHLLHNVAAMTWSEHERLSQRCSQAQQPETAKVMAPEHPSIRTLLGSTEANLLKIAKQVYGGSMCLSPLCSPASSRRSVWCSYTLNWPSV